MRLGVHPPDLRSGIGVQGVDVAVGVTEKRGMAVVSDRDCGFDGIRSAESPPGAAGGGVERVHRAILAAYEQFARERSRLAVGRGHARISKRPFQFELLNSLPIQAGRTNGLIARVTRIDSPPCPDGGVGRRIEIARTET